MEADMKLGKKTKLKRFEQAPKSAIPVHTGQVTGVFLAPDETVTWIWTHYPDGTSAVTGYHISKKLSRK